MEKRRVGAVRLLFQSFCGPDIFISVRENVDDNFHYQKTNKMYDVTELAGNANFGSFD